MRPVAAFFLRLLAALLIVLLIGVFLGDLLVRIEASDIVCILRCLGIKVAKMGNILVFDHAAFAIAWECSGLFTIALYTSLIISLPRLGYRDKLLYLVLGCSLIYLINLLRILASIVSYIFFGEPGLNTIHYVVGPIVLYATMLIIWGFVLRRVLSKTH